jgi:hypothetical protein
MKNVMRLAASASLALLVTGNLRAQQKPEHPTKDIVQPKVLTEHELLSEDHTADVVAVESVFSAYAYYNDSHNGPAIASLFTEDAVVRFVWNKDGTGELVPEFGPKAYDTPSGPNGAGCVLTGHKDIETYYGYNRDKDNQPLPIPGRSHHMVVNKMVKVADDGKTAMMTANWMGASEPGRSGGAGRPGGAGQGPVSEVRDPGAKSEDLSEVGDPGGQSGDPGTYRIFFRKTSDGWKISEFYGIGDGPAVTSNCDPQGPLPRPKP